MPASPELIAALNAGQKMEGALYDQAMAVSRELEPGSTDAQRQSGIQDYNAAPDDQRKALGGMMAAVAQGKIAIGAELAKNKPVAKAAAAAAAAAATTATQASSGDGSILPDWITSALGSAVSVITADAGDDWEKGGEGAKKIGQPHPTSMLVKPGGKLGGPPHKVALVKASWKEDAKAPAGWSYRLNPGERFADLALTYIGDGAWFPSNSGQTGGMNRMNQANAHIAAVATGHHERLQAGQVIYMPAEAVAGAKEQGVIPGGAAGGKPTGEKTPEDKGKDGKSGGLLGGMPTWARWGLAFGLLGTVVAVKANASQSPV